MTVLAAAPTPQHAQRLTRRKIVTLLHRCGRRNDPALVDQIHRDLRAQALRQAEPVEAALDTAATGLIQLLTAMQRSVEDLDKQLATVLDEHPLAPILRSAPGLGPILADRVLAEVGDDPAQFRSANGLRAFAGTAPVTRASGRSRYVKARTVRNKRLADACHWWAFYNRRRAAGDHHNAALSNLATNSSDDCGGACTPANPGTNTPPGAAHTN